MVICTIVLDYLLLFSDEGVSRIKSSPLLYKTTINIITKIIEIVKIIKIQRKKKVGRRGAGDYFHGSLLKQRTYFLSAS